MPILSGLFLEIRVRSVCISGVVHVVAASRWVHHEVTYLNFHRFEKIRSEVFVHMPRLFRMEMFRSLNLGLLHFKEG